MFSSVHSALRVIRKKGLLLPPLQRSPRERMLHLILTALLSIVIVLIGYPFSATPDAAATEKLEDSGVISLSSSQLVTHTENDHGSGYWFGPIAEDIFLDNDNESGTDIITYLPKGADLSNMPSPLVTIVTYDNKATFASKIHSLRSGSVSQFVTTGGEIVQYSRTSMEDEIVTIPGKPQIVVITYPTSQTAEALIANANKLQLVG